MCIELFNSIINDHFFKFTKRNIVLWLKNTILVVDDEPNSLFVTSQILKDQSYQVITAENGTYRP